MTEVKHAPAPWRANPRPQGEMEILDANGDPVIGGCGCCGSPYGGDHAKADKALMIASPDLLAAAVAVLNDVRGRHPGEALHCPYMIALDAAVTKASPAA